MTENRRSAAWTPEKRARQAEKSRAAMTTERREALAERMKGNTIRRGKTMPPAAVERITIAARRPRKKKGQDHVRNN